MNTTALTNDTIAEILISNSVLHRTAADGLYCLLKNSPAWWASIANTAFEKLHKEDIAPCSILIDAWVICNEKEEAGKNPSLYHFMSKLMQLSALYAYCMEGSEEKDSWKISELADVPYTQEMLKVDCHLMETTLHGKQSSNVLRGIKSLIGKLEKRLLLNRYTELEDALAERDKQVYDMLNKALH